MNILFKSCAMVLVGLQIWLAPTTGLAQSAADAKKCFADADLARLELQERQALLYVWSPRMVLSATQAQTVQETAAAQQLVFLPLVDPKVSQQEWQAALHALPTGTQKALSHSQSLCADRLLELDATRHFPTSFVLRKGELDPLPLVGAMPTSAWQQRLHTKQCIAANEFVPLPPALAGTQTDAYGKTSVALGAYERISPNGRLILRSYSGARIGEVSLVELEPARWNQPTQVRRIISTPLSNEAFPVQGSWRYLVSTSGEHYALQDVLQQGKRAKPLFQGGMAGFYAAASELAPRPQDPPEHVRIRSFSWPNPTGDAAAITNTQGEGALAVRTITVDTRTQRITHDTGHTTLCSQRRKEDGAFYALPMISVDGEEFAALPQKPASNVSGDKPTLRIYAFGEQGNGCEARTTFDFASGKAIFGFPSLLPKSESRSRLRPGSDSGSQLTARQVHAPLAYEYKGQIWWYQRELGVSLNLAPDLSAHPHLQHLDASAFPGITQDGRVMYAATWQRCTDKTKAQTCQHEGGYVIADPWQSHALSHLLQGTSKNTWPRCLRPDQALD